MPFNMEVGLGPGDFVLDGDPTPQGGPSAPPPKFSAHVYCGQTAAWMKLVLGMEVDLSPGDFVLDGDPVPSPKRGRSPQFSAHVCYGQTAEWIKMPLRTKVGLSPGDCVRWVPSPLPKKAEPPIFGPCLLWPSGWMDQDGTWHGDRPWSRPQCARWDPAPLPKKGTEPPPIFGRFLLWPNGWMHQDAI